MKKIISKFLIATLLSVAMVLPAQAAKQYDVVCQSAVSNIHSHSELIEGVEKKLSEGWALQGGVSSIAYVRNRFENGNSKKEVFLHCQALVK